MHCRNRRLLAYKKREIRLENATKKLGRDKARETACERQRNREQGRDYELELAILQAKHQDEIQMKVADARWSPGSSRGSRYQREDGSYSFRG
jgi:type II secretory pathway component PulJ